MLVVFQTAWSRVIRVIRDLLSVKGCERSSNRQMQLSPQHYSLFQQCLKIAFFCNETLSHFIQWSLIKIQFILQWTESQKYFFMQWDGGPLLVRRSVFVSYILRCTLNKKPPLCGSAPEMLMSRNRSKDTHQCGWKCLLFPAVQPNLDLLFQPH